MPKKPLNYVPVGNGNAKVKIDKFLVAGFTETFLQFDFDDPAPIAPFHYDIWELFTSDFPRVAIAAPRGHAKSTAGTLAYGLASLLFGASSFLLLVSATERLAAGHLANMARVLSDNKDLATEFDVEVLQCNETELTVRAGDREFHVLGKGAEQKVRGSLWRNKRPDLILVDDLEEDEAVMSRERREKLSLWFFNALVPCGSKNCRVRFLGTVLHLDSLLQNLLEDEKNWRSLIFSAHKSFDDFSDILWPETFSEERLRDIRAMYLSRGNASGYSQEYLSKPIAECDQFFRKSDFRAMQDKDHDSPKEVYASIDFALGEHEKSDKVAICVAGMDPEGILHVLDVISERMDPVQSMEAMFEIQRLYNPVFWVVEDENISKAIGPFLNQEMMKRGEWLELVRIRPTKEKQQRAVSIKARMRAGGVRFDSDAPWYGDLLAEMLDFPRGKTDDKVDALAWIGLMLDKVMPSLSREELDELAWEEEMEETGGNEGGRSHVTGY